MLLNGYLALNIFDIKPLCHYDCAPMLKESLPRNADLRKLANRHARFEIESDLTAFTRVADAVIDGAGQIKAAIEFYFDEQHRICVDGKANASAKVQCQRCLEPVEIEFVADITLARVKDDEQAQQLPKTRDALYAEEESSFDLNTMLEDELLLALPFVSYHNETECEGITSYQTAEQSTDVVVEKKENPFNVLAQLKPNK